MKLFFQILCIVLCLLNTDGYAATRKKPKRRQDTTVVEIDEATKKAQDLQNQNIKYTCGYSRPLRVASGMLGNAPFAWEEYTNVAKTKYTSFGLGMEIINRLSKKLNFMYESTGFATYEEALKALKKGEIDVLFAVYYRPLGMGAKQIYPGYFNNPFTVYVKKDGTAHKNLTNVQSYKDLVGWRGVIREEENIYPLIHPRTKDLKLKEVLSAPKVFRMLLEDEADYLIGSPYAIEAELRRQKLQDDIVSIGKTLDQASLFFAFSTNSNCRGLAKDFETELSQHPLSATETDQIIRQLIDDWGNRFREEKGLLEKDQESSQETDSEKAEK